MYQDLLGYGVVTWQKIGIKGLKMEETLDMRFGRVKEKGIALELKEKAKKELTL